MGYMRHHAIVVTGVTDDENSVEQAHKKATELFQWVSPISPVHINNIISFFIPPDGSKEGWGDSNIGDDTRDEFIDYLSQKNEYLDWAEIQYGDDDGVTKIYRHSDQEILKD